MSEGEIVDARGLGCPQPVILAKRALEREASVLVIVDNAIARENVRRLGVSSGCDVQTADPGVVDGLGGQGQQGKAVGRILQAQGFQKGAAIAAVVITPLQVDDRRIHGLARLQAGHGLAP